MKIVTSEYNDSNKLLSWIPEIEKRNIDFLIYHKDDSLKKNESIIIDKNNINIPNYGRCDYAFLYHIVQNYDNLDDITIFVKSHWYEHGLELYKVIDNCVEYDWMQSGTHKLYQYWKESKNMKQPCEYIYRDKHIFAETCYDWYNEIFPNIEKPEFIDGWGHFPCFSVSKQLILRHSKEVYIRLLNKFYPESNSWNINEGYKYFNTLEEQVIDIGKHYHDQFGRFYEILFTHNLNNYDYKIYR